LSVFQEGQERDFSSVSLDQFYVLLRICRTPPTLEKTSSRSGQRQSGLTCALTNLLALPNNLGRHLALLDDAISGKTTILRHLSGALAQAGLS